ncbi:MAG: hypothetical protein IIB65_08270 [Proteobacteria bacterium]|nr:hypothetical protein [Pseudomonadota bacterium]
MQITPAVLFLNAISNVPAQGRVPPQAQTQAPEVAKQAQATQTGAHNGVTGRANAEAQPPANAPRGSVIDITV